MRAHVASGSVGHDRDSPGRLRPGLSPIALRVALAASQNADGVTLTRLARAIGSPVSSVQTALRSLSQLQLISRLSTSPPRYMLNCSRPATASVLEVATALEDPARTIAALARANPEVVFASADAGGFLLATSPSQDADAVHELEVALERVRRHHPDCPRVVRMGIGDLSRMVKFDRMLALRIETGAALVGDASLLARAATSDA